ncbi:MAG TPA: hypothetical protein VGN72_17610 [Tepidisphaeraceae bacterium]|jgi:hypothetical protein|nr:hypothetical protein [Tepidisphaeraceae bacterium]
MSNPRHLIAALVLVTALFADRAAVAAPSLRPAVMEQTAARIIDRLTARVRRVVPVAIVYRTQDAPTSAVAAFKPTVPTAVEPVRRPSSPFQYRLPPPTC